MAPAVVGADWPVSARENVLWVFLIAVRKLTHICYPRIARSKGLTVQIRRGDLSDPQIISLLERHLARARAETAPGSAHALDLAGLRSPEIGFWAAWDDGVLLGVGALKRLSSDHGEVKSMHTAESVRRTGIGTAVLRHLIAEARNCGLSRLNLETGSWDYFKSARAF